MSKKENLQIQINQAQRKLENIRRNSQQLGIKKVNIEKQIAANQEKEQKILFFLEKTQKALQS